MFRNLLSQTRSWYLAVIPTLCLLCGHLAAQELKEFDTDYLQSPAASIASGTSEIMRGIIAMQVLGLPRGT